MPRRRTRKQDASPAGGGDPEAEAHALLEGGRPPEAERLFQLIHRVNPSNRPLPDRERKRLYRLKARLQSLLIAEFRDSIQVEAVPANPSVVSLRHRFSRGDGCHALVSELDAPARYWVESQLHRT